MKPADTTPNGKRSITRRSFLQWVGGGLLACVGTAGYAGDIEPNDFEITRLALNLKGWPQDSAGLTIGQLSDFHCVTHAAVERTKHSVRLLLDQKPDIVFLTGDFLTRFPDVWTPLCADALAPLTQSLPGRVFAIPGNHDWWCHGIPILTQHLQRVGIPLLRNESVPMPGVPGVWIVGLDDFWEQHQNVELALKHVPKDAMKILLVHEPDYADEAPDGFALQLSGHSHGGQICLPLLPPLHTPHFARRYKVGLEQSKNHPIYITRGIGMVGPSFRLFCPPEVTILKIYPQSA